MSASALFVHRCPSIRPPRASVRQQRTCSIPLGRVGQVAGARSTPEYGIRLFRAATAGMAVDSWLSGTGSWPRRPQTVGSRDAIADDPDTGTNALCGGARRSRHPDVVRTPSSELRRLHTSKPMTSSSDSDPDVVRTVVGVAQRRRVHIQTRSY